MNSEPKVITSRNHCDRRDIRRHTTGDRSDQVRRGDDADIKYRLMFEPEAVAICMSDVDTDHHSQIRSRQEGHRQRGDREHHCRAVGQPRRHHARRDGPEPLGRMLAIRLDVAGVIDQIHRRRGQRERDERDGDLDRDLAPVVGDVAAERGDRRDEHEQVLHPLAGPGRLDQAGDDVAGWTFDGCRFFAASSPRSLHCFHLRCS